MERSASETIQSTGVNAGLRSAEDDLPTGYCTYPPPADDRFRHIANTLIQVVVKPRLRELAGYFHFDRGRFIGPDVTHPYCCQCVFGGSPRYPARALLTVNVVLTLPSFELQINHELSTAPLGAIACETHSRLTFPLSHVNVQQVDRWLQNTIAELNDGFLTLRSTCQYGVYHRFTDPVCGRPTPPRGGVHTVRLHRQTYEFCSSACYQQFLRSPYRYILPATRGGMAG